MAGTKRKISEVDDVETQPLPSVKDLASSEASLRRVALQNIQKHLESRSPSAKLTQIQAEQLWRGFHVLLYMHDSKNAISVQNLTLQLAQTFQTMRQKDEQIEAQTAHSSDENGGNGPAELTGNAVEEDDFAGFDSDDDNVNKPNNNDSSNNDDGLPSESDIDHSWLSTHSLAFWNTMIREWSAIDSHRLNKYLYLVRLVIRESFTICFDAAVQTSLASTSTPAGSTSTSTSTDKKAKKSKTKSKPQPALDEQSTTTTITTASTPPAPTKAQLSTLLQSQTAILSTLPLHPRNSKIPNGLRFHILDLYNEEMERAVESVKTNAKTNTKADVNVKVKNGVDLDEVLEEMRGPVRLLARIGMDKRVRIRAREEVEAFDLGSST